MQSTRSPCHIRVEMQITECRPKVDSRITSNLSRNQVKPIFIVERMSMTKKGVESQSKSNQQRYFASRLLFDTSSTSNARRNRALTKCRVLTLHRRPLRVEIASTECWPKIDSVSTSNENRNAVNILSTRGRRSIGVEFESKSGLQINFDCRPDIDDKIFRVDTYSTLHWRQILVEIRSTKFSFFCQPHSDPKST